MNFFIAFSFYDTAKVHNIAGACTIGSGKTFIGTAFSFFFLLRVRVSCAVDGMVIKKGCSCGTPL